MKCRYKYCKLGGEVDKNIAIKEGNAYYHKECLCEKHLKEEIETYYINNMPPCTLQILRKVIKQLVHEKNFEAEYILFIEKYIKQNKKNINNPFGLISYCNDGNLSELFKKEKIAKEYNKIKKENNDLEFKDFKFTYKPPKNKWTDIL